MHLGCWWIGIIYYLSISISILYIYIYTYIYLSIYIYSLAASNCGTFVEITSALRHNYTQIIDIDENTIKSVGKKPSSFLAWNFFHVFEDTGHLWIMLTYGGCTSWTIEMNRKLLHRLQSSSSKCWAGRHIISNYFLLWTWLYMFCLMHLATLIVLLARLVGLRSSTQQSQCRMVKGFRMLHS